MAGHRKKHGTPVRSEARRARMQGRMAAAQTAEEQLAIAFDWYRMNMRRSGSPAFRSRCMREAAEYLVRAAEQAGGEV